ncbi:hypothetical protein D9613_007411 [Agrocybe pediades]|uniref:Uncharacterized protein n=1 Tax=Agrocybe pediades TaxID=84607 RepID=A0A8H4QLX3_9AGAR|nr:hypothetical protein D9613_007411 [Agrocybe pediades]
MLFELFREQIFKLFPILKPALVLLHERLNAAPVTGFELSATSLPVIIRRHGRFTIAILYVMVEILAFLSLFYNHGISRCVDSTLPLVESHAWIVFHTAYVYIVNCLYPLVISTTTYLGHNTVGYIVLKIKGPALRLARIIHFVLSLFFGIDHISITINYLQTLPSRLFDYALCQARRKLYSPCRDMKRTSPLVAFLCRRAFELFALMVLWFSVIFAFLFVYVVGTSHRQSLTRDDEREPGRVDDERVEEADSRVNDSAMHLSLTVVDTAGPIDTSDASNFAKEDENTVLGDRAVENVEEEAVKEQAVGEEEVVDKMITEEGILVSESRLDEAEGGISVQASPCDIFEEEETESASEENVSQIERAEEDRSSAAVEHVEQYECAFEEEGDTGVDVCTENVEHRDVELEEVIDRDEESEDVLEDSEEGSSLELVFDSSFGDNLLDIDMNEALHLSYGVLDVTEEPAEREVSFVSSTIEHANLGDMLTIETREVLISIHPATSVGSDFLAECQKREVDSDYLLVGRGLEWGRDFADVLPVEEQQPAEVAADEEEDDSVQEQRLEVIAEEDDDDESSSEVIEDHVVAAEGNDSKMGLEELGGRVAEGNLPVSWEGGLIDGGGATSESYTFSDAEDLDIEEAEAEAAAAASKASEVATARALLVKQRARQMMMGMSSWVLFDEEEKALVL